MSIISRKPALAGLVAVCLQSVLVPALSWADPATAKVPSDFTGKEVKIEVTPGEIDTKAREVKITAGGYTGKDDNKGATVQLTYTDPHYIGTVQKDHANGVLLDPNFKGTVKYNPEQKELQTIEVQGANIAAWRAQIASFNGKSATPEEVRNQKCADPDSEYIPNGGSSNAPPPVPNADGSPAAYGYCEKKKPQTTAEVTVGSGQGQYRRDKLVDIDQKGGSIQALSFSAHTAFKINSVPIDLCGRVGLGKLVIGETRIADVQNTTGWRTAEVAACLGVGLGKVGRLYDTAQVEHDYVSKGGHNATILRFTNSAGVERIGGTGLGVGYSFSTSKTENASSEGKAYHEHMVNMQYAF